MQHAECVLRRRGRAGNKWRVSSRCAAALTAPSAWPTAIWLAAGEAAICVTSPATLPDCEMGGLSVFTCAGSGWKQACQVSGGGGDRRQSAARAHGALVCNRHSPETPA